MIGAHVVTIGGLDVSELVDTVSINHGRQDTTSQPEASSCTIDIATVYPTFMLPDAVDIGVDVVVTTVLGALTYDRFRGRVTDMSLGWDDAGAATPDRGVGQVVATGPMADLGRRVVGGEPYPSERDGDRVGRVAAAAGVTLDPAYSDPGTVTLLPREESVSDALAVITEAAESANGMLWESRAGHIRYADADHRRGVRVGLELDACDVLVTPTWSRNLDGLTNAVTITYGVAPEGESGSEQPRYVAENPYSIERYGRYETSPSTQLAAEADAEAMARLLLVRNSAPVWVMSTLPVDLVDLKEAETSLLLDLDVHSLLRVTGLPTVGTVPSAAVLWVEGWRETLSWGAHDIELSVSGYCRTVPPPEWNDLDPTLTWDLVEADLTWDGATCLGPPATFGRWSDVAASDRWDLLDPALTWDTYRNL